MDKNRVLDLFTDARDIVDKVTPQATGDAAAVYQSTMQRAMLMGNVAGMLLTEDPRGPSFPQDVESTIRLVAKREKLDLGEIGALMSRLGLIAVVDGPEGVARQLAYIGGPDTNVAAGIVAGFRKVLRPPPPPQAHFEPMPGLETSAGEPAGSAAVLPGEGGPA